jgi:nicotinate-nucleotide adenylyltransferase
MVEIALFGTSADPPTLGHQVILKWLAQRFDQVVVWAADNPFKVHGASLEQRTVMLQRLVEDFSSPDLNVSVHPELSFRRTLETVKKARQQWSEAIFTLVIGSDLLPQLPQWYRAAELLSQVKLLVIPRPGYPIQELDMLRVKQLGTAVAIADLTGLDVSSTAYRENGSLEDIPPPIAAYIQQEQLYTCQELS